MKLIITDVSVLFDLYQLEILPEFFAKQPHVSPLVGNPNIDLSTIMELALQLLPKTEPEFLDEARALLQGEPQQPDEQLPEYNYSAMVVQKKETS